MIFVLAAFEDWQLICVCENGLKFGCRCNQVIADDVAWM